jgi:hypothetical protein
MKRSCVVLLTCLLAGSVLARQVPSTSPTTPVVETLRTFEPRNVKLTWHNRHWQLTHHGDVLKDFGLREQEARQALRIIQDLHLNQYGTVGSPPVMEYWLCDGVAPQAQARHGLRTLPLDVARIRAEEVRGQCCLRDGQRTLYNFRQQADARQALAVMQKYHFDQVGMIGQPAPTMYVFLSRMQPETPTLPAPRTSATGGHNTRPLETPRFSPLTKGPDGSPRRDITGAAASPLAGLPTPALPPVTKQLPKVETGPVQPNLTARQAALWRGQPHFGAATQPAASVPAQGDRIAFDWRQVQLKQNGGDWQLVAGSLVLANFDKAHEARLALSALRHYRFTEQRRVGGDRPVVSYYAATRQSPRGLMMGLQGQVLLPEQMEVQQVGSRYALCSGKQVVLEMGERRDDATKLLEVIKTNKYDRLCQLGEPGKEGMTLLVRSR